MLRALVAVSAIISVLVALDTPRQEESYQRKVYPIGDLIKPSSGKADPDKVKAAVAYVIYALKTAWPDTESGGNGNKSLDYYEKEQSLMVSQTPAVQERIQVRSTACTSTAWPSSPRRSEHHLPALLARALAKAVAVLRAGWVFPASPTSLPITSCVLPLPHYWELLRSPSVQPPGKTVDPGQPADYFRDRIRTSAPPQDAPPRRPGRTRSVLGLAKTTHPPLAASRFDP